MTKQLSGLPGMPKTRREPPGPDAPAAPKNTGLPGLTATLWKTCRTPQRSSTAGTRSSWPMETPPLTMSRSAPSPRRTAASRRY
jgi:hypothetical protein